MIDEAARGDAMAAAARLALLQNITLFVASAAANELAEQLLVARAKPEVARLDAAHVAIAAVNGADYLLTWNCRHIANGTMRKAIDQVCRAAGFEPPTICTPEELVNVR